MKSVIGYKIGMTQVFTEEGVCIPVTVVEVEPNVVLQKRSIEKGRKRKRGLTLRPH